MDEKIFSRTHIYREDYLLLFGGKIIVLYIISYRIRIENVYLPVWFECVRNNSNDNTLKVFVDFPRLFGICTIMIIIYKNRQRVNSIFYHAGGAGLSVINTIRLKRIYLFIFFKYGDGNERWEHSKLIPVIKDDYDDVILVFCTFI